MKPPVVMVNGPHSQSRRSLPDMRGRNNLRHVVCTACFTKSAAYFIIFEQTNTYLSCISLEKSPLQSLSLVLYF